MLGLTLGSPRARPYPYLDRDLPFMLNSGSR
jgi:hypothetical protein